MIDRRQRRTLPSFADFLRTDSMILLLGATGYLGQAFAREMRERRIDFIPLSRRSVDYTRFDVLFNYIRATRPSFLINAAGFTGPGEIECSASARIEAVQANVVLPRTIARACRLAKTAWGHVSSSAIYSGAKIVSNGSTRTERDINHPEIVSLMTTNPDRIAGFAETDEPNCTFRTPPCSFYSGTKALAEEDLVHFEQTYIWRPGCLFDELDHPRNSLSLLRRDLVAPCTANSFSHRRDFVHACLQLWQQRAEFGVYNVVNPRPLGKHHLSDAVHDLSSSGWISDEYRSAGAALQTASPGCVLDASKIRRHGVYLRSGEEALCECLERWIPARHLNGPRFEVTRTAGIR